GSAFWCGNDVWEQAPYGGATRVLHTGGRGEPPHDFVLDRGGRIRVGIEGVRGELCDPTVDLFLAPKDGGWPIRVEFLSSGHERRTTWLTRLCEGSEVVSERFPAGEYDLVARHIDGRLARQSLRLVEEETVEVRIALPHASDNPAGLTK
ncbi:MAG: hypothetical protein AAF368_14060, partial [Planctomycetota bacterium]